MAANPLARIPWRLVGGIALRCYLCLFLAGCAGTAPRPTLDDVRRMETRVLDADVETLLKAAIGALQDLGYTVEVIQTDVGLITASRRSETEEPAVQLEPADENPEEDRDGPPTWAVIVGIVLVVGLVILVVNALSGDDDEDQQSCERTRTRSRDNEAQQESDTSSPEFDLALAGSSGATVYEYRVTVNLDPLQPGSGTRVRVSCEGTTYEGGRMAKAGPVHDPVFYEQFFAGLDESLHRLRPGP